MTKSALYIEVLPDNSYNDELLGEDTKKFVYKLVIKSDYLNRYEFKVLAISHGILQYPLEIFLPDEIASDLSKNPDIEKKLAYNAIVENSLVAKNEEEFIEYLGHILKTNNLLQIIKTLHHMSVF